MKKILLAAFAASLLAAGCQKTEVYQPANSGEKMTFSTEMKKITKADGDGTTDETEEPDNQGTTTPTTPTDGDSNLISRGFKVWAYADFPLDNVTNVDNETLIYDGMNGMSITYNGGWKTPENTQYYWPGIDKYLRFFAVSSASVQNMEVIPIHGIGDNATPSMSINAFTVNSEANNDLMVADFRRQHQGQDNRVVNLNFRHTLSKVEFKFKTTAVDGVLPTVFVQKLEVTGLHNKADLAVQLKGTYSPETLNNEVEFVWSNQTGGTSNVVSFTKTWGETADGFPTNITPATGETSASDGKALKLTADAETFASWLMLPDANVSEKLVTITYVIGNRQFKTSFKLGGKKTNNVYQLSSWGVNQYITYTIDLSPNMISFNASSTDWTPKTDIGMNN